MSSRIKLVAVAVTLFLLPSSLAAAQAWVNAKGELSLGLRSDYQYAAGVWHGPVLVTGIPTQSINTALGAEYVPFENLAIGLGINTNGSSYGGPCDSLGTPKPCPPPNPNGGGIIYAHGSQDDGSFHFNVTDLEGDVHYQVLDKAIALTPLFRFKVPVTNYENNGYAAAGSHLKEAGLGFYLGRYGLGLEDLVLQFGYTFTYVSKYSGGGAATEKYRVNRSDADLSLSYVFGPKLIAGVAFIFRYTHDGFDLEQYPMLPAGDPLILHHDPVLKAEYFAPAALLSYQLSPSLAINGRLAYVVWGNNASNPFSVGFTLTYQTNLVD